MSAIIPFDFETQAVRVVMMEDEPWFVAADCCRVLDHSNPTVALGRLDDDEKMIFDPKKSLGSNGLRGGAQRMNLVSESGLFALILTSNKPEARKFRKWVTAEVLPSIRRDGVYRLPKSELAVLQAKREYVKSLPEKQRARAKKKAAALHQMEKVIEDGHGKTIAVIQAAEENGISQRTLWEAKRRVFMVAPSDYEAANAPQWRLNGERGDAVGMSPRRHDPLVYLKPTRQEC
jgi:prophage antirepressor-like protein